MKKLGIVGICCFGLLLGACENSKSEPSKANSTQSSEIKKNELEELGFTYGQSIKFDKFCEAVSQNISNLQDFENKVSNEYETLDDSSTADILISVGDIESSYLDNGGKDQDGIVKWLQESTFGFYALAQNMYKYERSYTVTEAYGALTGLLSYVKEIGENYNLTDSDSKKLQVYFLKNIDTKGAFKEADQQVLEKIK